MGPTGIAAQSCRRTCRRKEKGNSWFVLDTVSAIPWGMLEQGGGLSNLAGLKLLKSGRVLKAIKLLRFLKLSRLLKGSKFFLSIDWFFL